MKHGLICLLFLTALPPLYAQQVGDTVIVVVPSGAKLKMENRVVGVVPRGASLEIEEAKNGGFRVRWKGTSGWIAKEDVLSPDGAIKSFTKAIKQQPQACDYRGRGNARYDKKCYDKAIDDYNEAIRLDPKSAAAYYDRAGAFYDKGDYDRAIADCTEALRNDPKLGDAYRARGCAWYMKRNYDKAIVDYTEAIHLDPKSAAAYCGRACAFYGKDDYDLAITDFTQAIRNDPNCSDAYSGRGLAWHEKHDNDKAIADYTQAIRHKPKSGQPFYYRGTAWFAKGDWGKAIADYTESMRLGVKDGELYCDRGLAYMAMQNMDRARADFAEAIRLDPRCKRAYLSRGGMHVAKGDSDKAIADFTEAIHLDAKDAVAYSDRGVVYANKGDLDKAIADYTEAIRLDDTNADTYSNRAAAYYQRGDFHRAVADFTEIIRKDPENGNAYFNRGATRQAQGDYKRAIADYTEAIRRGVKNVETYSNRGDALYEKGDTTMAIEDYTAAIALSPKSPCLYEIRAKFLIARGDYDLGMRDLETAIRLNPKDQAAKFEAWPKTPLSAESLRHGERQVRQMLKDRKVMEDHGKLAEPLYQWAIRKFAGEDLGEEIFWNAADPIPRFNGCNNAPMGEKLGWIMVRETDDEGPDVGKKLSFEKAWSVAVFELYNIANAKEVDRLYLQGSSGEISKEQFAGKRTEIESRAAEKARSFYIHVFIPWAKQHRIPSDPQSWFLGTRCDPEAPILGHIDKTDTYWQEHERAYESLVALAKTAKANAEVSPKELPEQAATKQQKPASGGGGVAASATKPRTTAELPVKAKGIEPLDVLTVWASGTLLDQPVRGRFLVEPSGKVLLGPAYGRVEVKGLTIEEAEKAIKKKLDEVLIAPEVEVLAAGRATQWPGEMPMPSSRIGPNYLLRIRAIPTIVDRPIDGDYRVDASGKVQLGEPYGSLAIKGLTLEEAEQAITKELRKVLDNPQVSVSLTGWKRGPKGSGSR
jgi:tetratricopeptide (TPR) repeat protein